MAPNQPTPEPIPVQLGNFMATLIPHHIENLGARVFLVLDGTGGHLIANLTLDNVREFETRLKLAILEAEALERKAQRRRA